MSEVIIEYVELTAKKIMYEIENISVLLRLAVINNRLTEQQAGFLEEEFCRDIIECQNIVKKYTLC